MQISSKFYLKNIPKKEANNFFSKYEHLGNSGLGSWHYGLFENDNLLSVVSYGPTCFSPKRGFLSLIAQKYNMKIIQLCRGGTKQSEHNNLPSQIVSNSLKVIRENHGNSIVIAYSDTKFNEMGTIYQACNAIYLGLTNPGGQANYLINGKIVSGWTVRKKYGTRNLDILKNLFPNIKKIPLSKKHVYIFLMTSAREKNKIQNELGNRICCYPKREKLGVGSMKKDSKALINT